MFRRGNYPQALQVYSDLAAESPSRELDRRVERTRYFLMEQGVRNLLHLDRSEDALEILDYIEGVAPVDRVEVVAGLRARTLKQIGRRHYDLGFEYYEATLIEAAAREYVLCLSWDPENEAAKTSLARCEQWLATREILAEDYYFQGMEHLRKDQDLRARTSFMHAATLLEDDDSQAAERLANLTASLAEESREKSLLYMEAGLTGQAWVAAQDAVYLAPDDPRNQELAKHLADTVLSNAYLVAADVARRGGETSAADEFLQKTRELGVVQHRERIRTVAELNQDRKNSDHYARARAYELDNQMVHARDRYQEILDEGFEFHDLLVGRGRSFFGRPIPKRRSLVPLRLRRQLRGRHHRQRGSAAEGWGGDVHVLRDARLARQRRGLRGDSGASEGAPLHLLDLGSQGAQEAHSRCLPRRKDEDRGVRRRGDGQHHHGG